MSSTPASTADRPAASGSGGRGGFLSTLPGKVTTAALTVIAIATAAFGAGAFGGTPIQDAAGGWLGPDGTWIAPASTAFSIWSVIYLGLIAYTVWQFLPSSDSARHDRLRPWILAGILLNSLWIWTVQAGWLAISVLVIAVLLAVLCRILVIKENLRVNGWGERILVDGVQGLYLGWVSIATVANVAAWLASMGWTGSPLGPIVWTNIMIVVATLVGAFTAVYSGGRLMPAVGLAWGLVWVAVGRSDGTGLNSASVAITAAGAAVIVMIAWAVSLWLSRRSATGEARDLILDALDGDGDPVDGRRA
ncbi:TspO/MBR family protein [Micrococcus terreus]|uniref:TspO/MBR family protein n=1 Tax=Micrococcus terreus TaxID=574650 RepID=UPI0023F905CF|nr:TspO/MBR family protein [Micrococcus terreus]